MNNKKLFKMSIEQLTAYIIEKDPFVTKHLPQEHLSMKLEFVEGIKKAALLEYAKNL